jgi:hypothetical protein
VRQTVDAAGVKAVLGDLLEPCLGLILSNPGDQPASGRGFPNCQAGRSVQQVAPGHVHAHLAVGQDDEIASELTSQQKADQGTGWLEVHIEIIRQAGDLICPSVPGDTDFALYQSCGTREQAGWDGVRRIFK